MVSPLIQLKTAIQHQKNYIIQQYFHFRIRHPNSPDQLFLRSFPLKFLVILGHMRSGSSLLSHILVSNPAIIGYGESHINYQGKNDFQKLLFKVYWQGQQPFNSWQNLKKLRMNHQYVLDKILHDSKILDPEILKENNIYAIFLIRRPMRTIPSILDLKPHWDVEKAVQHYVCRLKTLNDYARLINDPQKSVWLTYSGLLQQSDQVFHQLQTFLGTPVPFSENYQLNSMTGKKGIGDHKGQIKAGKIVRTKRELTHQLSPEHLAQCQTAYEECLATLSQYCLAIAPWPTEIAHDSSNLDAH